MLGFSAREQNQKGSLLIEAMAMLGLIAMVTPMLYRKAAERTSELQDINAAGQMRVLSNAVDTYLRDNYEIDIDEIQDNIAFSLFDLSNLETVLMKYNKEYWVYQNRFDSKKVIVKKEVITKK